MGFSYGGLVTATYNELYSPEINKLVIIDGPVKFFSVEMADSLAKLAGVNSMTNIIIPQSLTDFSAMQKAVLSKKFPATNHLKLKLIQHYFSPTLKSRQAQLIYLSAHQSTYQNYNYHFDTTPTLLVWGAKDGVVPLSVGQKLHARFPKTTQLIVYKKAKHDTHFRYAKKLNKAVSAFLLN
jgi:pimeloyl-ACP methyl ester carboxylesterase